MNHKDTDRHAHIEKRKRMERTIVSAVVDAALAAGYVIDVGQQATSPRADAG